MFLSEPDCTAAQAIFPFLRTSQQPLQLLDAGLERGELLPELAWQSAIITAAHLAIKRQLNAARKRVDELRWLAAALRACVSHGLPPLLLAGRRVGCRL